MLINSLEIDFITKVKLKTKINPIPARIFSRIDLESVLICKILIIFFRRNFISCELYPIKSWKNFNNRCKKFIIQKDEFVQLFLINFGGDLDLEKFLVKNSPIFSKIFVFDPKKIINKKNITSKHIFVFSNKLVQLSQPNVSILNDKFKNLPTNTQIFSSFLLKTKKENLENLWFQILSLSQQHFLNNIDNMTNSREMKILQTKLSWYSKKKIYKKKENNKFLFDYFNFNNPKYSMIELSLEFPFYLLRHWSLLDSMVNTPELFSHFCLWKKSGIKNISKFFLRLDFTIQEVKTPWNLLDKKKKKKFKKNVQIEMEKFDIHLLQFYSFVRRYFSKNFNKKIKNKEIEARDFVWGLKSLLDFEIIEFQKKKQIREFKNSLKAMDKLKILKIGIQMSKKILQFASRLTRFIIANKIYISETYFCYSYLKNIQNIKITYEMIKYLSFFLISAFFFGKSEEKEIFIIFIPSFQKTLVAGHILKKNQKKNRKRLLYFKNVILKIGAQIEEDSFFFFEIERKDEIKFLKILKNNI